MNSITRVIWVRASVSILCVVGALVGCSSQGVYDSARANGLQSCDRFDGAERTKCREQYDMTYQEYEQKRKEAGVAD